MTITENDLLEAITCEEALPLYDPSQHVTKAQIAERLGVKEKSVDAIMDGKRWQGRAVKIEVRMPTGRRQGVYVWKK